MVKWWSNGGPIVAGPRSDRGQGAVGHGHGEGGGGGGRGAGRRRRQNRAADAKKRSTGGQTPVKRRSNAGQTGGPGEEMAGQVRVDSGAAQAPAQLPHDEAPPVLPPQKLGRFSAERIVGRDGVRRGTGSDMRTANIRSSLDCARF